MKIKKIPTPLDQDKRRLRRMIEKIARLNAAALFVHSNLQAHISQLTKGTDHISRSKLKASRTNSSF